MTVICPTVTAFDMQQYDAQLGMLRPFARRIHVDLMDGEFAPTVSPMPDDIWLPEGMVCDIHLMFQRPMEQLERLISLKPHLVVIHAEAEADFAGFARRLHEAGIKAGLSLLQQTPVAQVVHTLADYDHVLIFSGNLGHHGGSAVDFALLDKVKQVRERYPDIEIAWDGGVSDQNAAQLAEGGIEVLNVGGFIHKAADPQAAYATLEAVTKEHTDVYAAPEPAGNNRQ